jgi:hypothetical protein
MNSNRACSARRVLAPLFVALSVFVAVMFGARRAEAYPWMIRHEYTVCTMCHADPSGAGLMTLYGRAQTETLLRTRYGKENLEEDPMKLGGFAFGLVPLPDPLLLQVDARSLFLHVSPKEGPSTSRAILMQADAQAGIIAGRFRASGSVGYLHEGGLGASVTRGTGDRLVSRQHWAGVVLGEDEQFLLRAGRMNLPYGLRVLEHTLFARVATRSDVNDDQQHGLALSYNKDGWRAEVMAIAGNYQIRPDALRDRGGAAYVEYAFDPKLAAGVTTQVTHAEYNPEVATSALRQAHGLFGRYRAAKAVVLMTEADVLVRSPKGRETDVGTTGFLQVDVEPLQGLHFAGTGEWLTNKLGDEGASLGGWLSAFWFFLPHLDFRSDLVYRSMAAGDSRMGVLTYLAQLHGWL